MSGYEVTLLQVFDQRTNPVRSSPIANTLETEPNLFDAK
jgi:hypothetical protein